MLSFTPSPKLEKALKAVQGNITRLATELARVPEVEAAWLHRWALISTIGASTRIENAVLTDAEHAGLVILLPNVARTRQQALFQAVLAELDRLANRSTR